MALRGEQPFENMLFAAASGCMLAYGIGLVLLFHAHAWILDANGKPLVDDFLEFWVVGRTALHEAAASV